MPKANTITTAQFSQITPRELDFVTRFSRNWDALREIMGIMRPIKKQPGTRLVSYNTTVTLANGTVAEGDEIPYSTATVVPVSYGDVEIEKYARAITIEAVDKYGAEIAIEKTDDEFLVELQNKVLTKFYTFLKTGSLVSGTDTFKAALAVAQGNVREKFASMDRDVTKIIGFVNILDVYDYLATADITVQTTFGLNYVKSFMGYETLFLLPDKYISKGTVIAVPSENINLYYIDPSDSQYGKLGLNYAVDGETNLIGFHEQGKYSNALGESYAIMGLTLWAEYLDGIAIVWVDAHKEVENPTGNPKTKGYYEKRGIQYVPTEDTSVVTGKTYYEKV